MVATFLAERIAEQRFLLELPDWYCTESVRGPGWGSRGDCRVCEHPIFDGTEVSTEEGYYEHLDTYHDRVGTLARMVAYERILDQYAQAGLTLLDEMVGRVEHAKRASAYTTLSGIVLILATEWKSHPNWNPDWEK